jgi:bisphosphoglycerate-independent phosphoglycerate mutase (AlkP superfamily)
LGWEPKERRPCTKLNRTHLLWFCRKAEDAPRYRLRSDGSLRGISPTLLNLLKLGLPKEMTGGDLRVLLAK